MKRNLSRAALIVFLFSVGAGGLYFAGTTYRQARARLRAKNYNILVVTSCSLRRDMVGLYSRENLTPNIDRFFSQGSYLFENLVNPTPWTSVIHFLRGFRQPVHSLGYEVLGYDTRGYVRIPERLSEFEDDGTEVLSNGMEKKLHPYLEGLKEKILRPHTKPFVAVVQLKYMHYPYMDRFNEDSGWDRLLSSKEKDLLRKYLANPHRYPEKLAFLLALTGDVKLIADHPEFKDLYARYGSGSLLLGLVGNKELIAEWKLSAGYEEDLSILRKTYQANAMYADKVLGEILNFYGDSTLRDNTIVIFAGDHGELHMERDELGHSTNVFEESVLIPAMIRFPGQSGGIQKIDNQIQMSSLMSFIREVMQTKSDGSDLAGYFASLEEPNLILRDCANLIRGLRSENRYKYFVKAEDASRYLFDLVADPGEQKNIAPLRPEIVAEMEKLYWANYGDASTSKVRHCAPWVEASSQ